MNIQSLPWLKFCHDHYLVSEFRGKASITAKAAYFELLCFAMKQSPALSIPNDDRVLAGWTGISKNQWQKIKDLVLSQFTLNPTDNRYYSPMLVELYSDNESHQPAEAKQPCKPSSSAERMARKRERDKLKASQQQESDANVSPANVTCDNDVTGRASHVTDKSVTLGGKGGDLELRTENEDKKTVVVVCEPVQQTPSLTTTTKFSMFFDFQIQTANIDLLMQKLNVAPSKNTADNLNNFIAHYLGSTYKNSQAEWELHYVKWIKREKDTPYAHIAASLSITTKTPPVHKTAPPLIVVKPLWDTLAELKAARNAAPPRDAQSLLRGEMAFAAMKKTLGIKIDVPYRIRN